MGKINLLISDTAKLYPPLWGGPKRIWNLFGGFTQDLFDITYVGIDYALSNGKKYRFNKISPNFNEVLCSFPSHYYPLHVLEKQIFNNTSLDLFSYLLMHTDWHFKHILCSQKADILVCSHPWAASSMHKNNGQMFIYDAHNCEYLLMKQILGRHLFNSFITRAIKQVEKAACEKSDLILVCSQKEKEDFINIYNIKSDKISIVPNGTNIVAGTEESFREDARRKKSIGFNEKVIIFIGAYYKPNIDAVKYIVDKIALDLGKFRFLIVGTVAEAFKGKRIPSNVNLIGKVFDKELHELLCASDIAVNTVTSGSGVNIKMLDYMSYGLPIVTTGCGARGIVTDNKCVMIVSPINKFSENIRKLAVDRMLCKQLWENARNLIAKRYNWKSISDRLENVVKERLLSNC